MVLSVQVARGDRSPLRAANLSRQAAARRSPVGLTFPQCIHGRPTAYGASSWNGFKPAFTGATLREAVARFIAATTRSATARLSTAPPHRRSKDSAAKQAGHQLDETVFGLRGPSTKARPLRGNRRLNIARSDTIQIGSDGFALGNGSSLVELIMGRPAPRFNDFIGQKSCRQNCALSGARGDQAGGNPIRRQLFSGHPALGKLVWQRR